MASNVPPVVTLRRSVWIGPVSVFDADLRKVHRKIGDDEVIAVVEIQPVGIIRYTSLWEICRQILLAGHCFYDNSLGRSRGYSNS